MEISLLPCPFCGKPTEYVCESDHHGDFFRLGCPDEECAAHWTYYTEPQENAEECIRRWNRRADKSDHMLECLQSIVSMKDEEPREPDDMDWRARALECQRAAQVTLAGLSNQSGAGAPETSVRCGAPADPALLTQASPNREEAADTEAVRESLNKIACWHITEKPLWWQVEARNALSTLSTSAPAQAEEGWRDISTAPKDGTQILLWAEAWEMSWGTQIGYFCDAKHEWQTSEGSVADNDGDFDWDDEEGEQNVGPTHWRPLPAPPAALSDSEGGSK